MTTGLLQREWCGRRARLTAMVQKTSRMPARERKSAARLSHAGTGPKEAPRPAKAVIESRSHSGHEEQRNQGQDHLALRGFPLAAFKAPLPSVTGIDGQQPEHEADDWQHVKRAKSPRLPEAPGSGGNERATPPGSSGEHYGCASRTLARSRAREGTARRSSWARRCDGYGFMANNSFPATAAIREGGTCGGCGGSLSGTRSLSTCAVRRA